MTVVTQNFRTTNNSQYSSDLSNVTVTDIVKYKNLMSQERLFYPKVAMALLHNHCCSTIAVCTKLYECVSVFLHYLSCMHSACAILYFNLRSVCLSVPYFPTLSHKRHDCRRRNEQKICSDFLCNLA